MTSPALAGTDASRPRSRILTPSSEGTLIREDGARPRASSPETRKRKREDSVAMDHLLKPSIALKPHPPNLHIQPRVMQPLMVLPRENLSLSCIDFHVTKSDLSPGRLFEAYIKVMDLESRMGSVPVVLLARYESSRNVYALERQPNGLYLTCPIGPWVDLEDLAKHANAICPERIRPISRPESRQSASTALTTPHLHKEQKVKRAAIEAIQSLVRKRPRSQSVSTFDDATRHEEPAQQTPNPLESQLPSPVLKHDELPESQPEPKPNPTTPAAAPKPRNLSASPPQQTAENIFETIRTQYFEALYRSMGSLAYFAKGPLSRARSAFHLDLESNLDMGDLIDFLKTLVLTTVQIDKKYRETMPHIIAKMKMVIESSDEGRKKKRRTKKMKLGKDGLYPYEEEHIQKWWIANKPELKEDETNVSPQQIKSLASMLRTRETQLQMILILEILALTPLRAAEDAEDSQLPPLPGLGESQASMTPQPTKKRNKHNLPVLVDVHADRLTIWQSTASDEQLLLEDSQVTRTPGGGQIEQKASSEPLKDFCVDVIVPFFSARLPDLCDAINRKLGGPVIVKPSKSRSVKRSASKRDQKPGAVTKRPSLGQQPRTLQRALSTEQQHRRSVSRGPSNMIALMRSATSTSLPGVKREGSEPASVKGALKGDADLLNRRSGPLSRNVSMSYLEDAKATKRAMVEAELKDAISALRKPQRGTVSKELVDAAERRTSTGLSAKKLRKPARPSIVKATPTNNRFKDMFAKTSESMADIPMMSTEELIPPSSLPSRIPSTGLRGAHADPFGNTPSRPLDRIDSTPTKGSRFLDRLENDEPSQSPWSPLRERRAVPDDDYIVPGSAIKSHRIFDAALPRDENIFATPVKASARMPTEMEPEQDAPAVKPMSIYQKLGWDDDLDDL